jgi:hypothetical protein
MSVTQTVEIPASHRLIIDVPREVPAGPVILTFTPAKKPADRKADSALESADEGEMSHVDALLGILSGLGDITLEQIRDERLARQLK